MIDKHFACKRIKLPLSAIVKDACSFAANIAKIIVFVKQMFQIESIHKTDDLFCLILPVPNKLHEKFDEIRSFL